MPRLSIVVPVYNTDTYLAECFDSLLAQDFADWEAVCVNDGSTDGSAEILAAYAARDPRFRIVNKANGGLSSARNAGIEAATAPYVCFLDSDDLFEPNACGQIVGILTDTGADVLTFGGRSFPAGVAEPWVDTELSPRDVVYEGFDLDVLFCEHSHPFAWRTACRTDFLRTNGISFDEGVRFGEDQVFHFAIYPRSHKTVLISDKLYHYRAGRKKSLMSDMARDTIDRLDAHLLIVRAILDDWERLSLLADPDSAARLLEWVTDFLATDITRLGGREYRHLSKAFRETLAAHWTLGDLLALPLSSEAKGVLVGGFFLPARPGRLLREAAAYRFHRTIWPEDYAVFNTKQQVKTIVKELPAIPFGRVAAMCRAEGRAYALVDYPFAVGGVRAAARMGDVAVPVAAYPLPEEGSTLADFESSSWVVTVPLMARSVIATVCVPGAKPLQIVFSRMGSKVRSRLLTATRPAVAQALRSSETHVPGMAHLTLTGIWPATQPGGNVTGANQNNAAVGDAIYRLTASFTSGDTDATPQLLLYDGAMEPICGQTIVMEDQTTPDTRTVTFSVRLPLTHKHVLMIAQLSAINPEAIANQSASGSDPTPALGSSAPATSAFACVIPVNVDARLGHSYGLLAGAAGDPRYDEWFRAHRTQEEELAHQRAAASELASASKLTAASELGTFPLISIVMPVFRPDPQFLHAAIGSVTAQTYPHWELVLVNASPDDAAANAVLADAARDERVKIVTVDNTSIAENTNAGIAAATGDYVGFCDHDDVLEPDCLWEYAQAITDHPEADLLYCDEDNLRGDRYCAPALKVDFDLTRLESHNYITHLLMVSRRALDLTERSSADVSGAQDYDLALKVADVARDIVHIPHVLYHWRQHEGSTAGGTDAKPYAHEAGRRALQAHFARRGIAADIEDGELLYTYRVRPRLPDPAPLISIVIPSHDHADLLEHCVSSILDKTTYTNYEIVVVENGSVEPETFSLYTRLGADERVRVVTWESVDGEDAGFNYSRLVNFGVSHTHGDLLVFLNNDTEVISPDWLEELAAPLARPKVGVVGAELLFEDGLVQHAGMLVHPNGNFGHYCQNLPGDAISGGYMLNMPWEPSMVTGACQMFRSSLFNELGGYDEALAVGYNDGDFCLRAREAGYTVVYTPYAKLYHREFSSRGRESTDARLIGRLDRERARFAEKHATLLAHGDPQSQGDPEPQHDHQLQHDPKLNPNYDPYSIYFELRRE